MKMLGQKVKEKIITAWTAELLGILCDKIRKEMIWRG